MAQSTCMHEKHWCMECSSIKSLYLRQFEFWSGRNYSQRGNKRPPIEFANKWQNHSWQRMWFLEWLPHHLSDNCGLQRTSTLDCRFSCFKTVEVSHGKWLQERQWYVWVGKRQCCKRTYICLKCFDGSFWRWLAELVCRNVPWRWYRRYYARRNIFRWRTNSSLSLNKYAKNT